MDSALGHALVYSLVLGLGHAPGCVCVSHRRADAHAGDHKPKRAQHVLHGCPLRSHSTDASLGTRVLRVRGFTKTLRRQRRRGPGRLRHQPVRVRSRVDVDQVIRAVAATLCCRATLTTGVGHIKSDDDEVSLEQRQNPSDLGSLGMVTELDVSRSPLHLAPCSRRPMTQRVARASHVRQTHPKPRSD